MTMAIRASAVAGLAMLAIALAGCGGNSVHAQMDAAVGRLDQALVRLGTALDDGSLRNAQLMKQYAAEVRSAKPELRDLVAVLAREGTREGTLYQGMKTRLDELRAGLPEAGSPTAAYVDAADEANRLAEASRIDEFNNALADPLNVLADLTDGKLPRVDAAPGGASRAANRATDFGTGSQLVGNPNYGHWQTNSSGTSFWVWYGQFALIRDLVGGPRIGYGAWAGGRDYSYYHDYGRRNYTSPSARRSQTQVESTARRKFANEGRTFRSPYGRTRQGASTRVARQKFASSRASGSATRSAGGATRTASTRRASFRGFGSSSRGPRRGK